MNSRTGSCDKFSLRSSVVECMNRHQTWMAASSNLSTLDGPRFVRGGYAISLLTAEGWCSSAWSHVFFGDSALIWITF